MYLAFSAKCCIDYKTDLRNTITGVQYIVYSHLLGSLAIALMSLLCSTGYRIILVCLAVHMVIDDLETSVSAFSLLFNFLAQILLLYILNRRSGPFI